MQEIDTDIQVIPISKRVIKFRAIVRGRVYEREYLGYKPTQALNAFKKWLKAKAE